MQRARLFEVVGSVQAGQQPADGRGALHLGGQRRRRDIERLLLGADQCNAALAQLGKGTDQLFRVTPV